MEPDCPGRRYCDRFAQYCTKVPSPPTGGPCDLASDPVGCGAAVRGRRVCRIGCLHSTGCARHRCRGSRAGSRSIVLVGTGRALA
eukprot:8657821-Lingulodinium_polyedra.AAC.1